MGEGMANFLMIALLAMAAIFVIKMIFRKKAEATPASEPMQFAGVGGPGMAPPPQAATGSQGFSAAMPAAAAAETVRRIPDGFDAEGFLRVAKLNFIRLQASNDARNLDDIREFVSPEMFAEIKMQITERGTANQETDVVSLNAELLEVVTEGPQHIASVRFSGMIREEAGATAAPFDEVWNLTKQVDGSKGWTISGIQQLG
jgi:predicted lipid-binding transport protein (Tim44 family)